MARVDLVRVRVRLGLVLEFGYGIGFGLGLALALALTLVLALTLTWPAKVFEFPHERILPCEPEAGPSAFNTPSWLAAGGSVKDAASKCLLDA